MWHIFLKDGSNSPHPVYSSDNVFWQPLPQDVGSLFPPSWIRAWAVIALNNRVELMLCDFQHWVTKRILLPLGSLVGGVHTWNLAPMLWGSPGHRERPHVRVLADSSNSQHQPPNMSVRKPSEDSSPAAYWPFQLKPNRAKPWLSLAQIIGSRAK